MPAFTVRRAGVLLTLSALTGACSSQGASAPAAGSETSAVRPSTAQQPTATSIRIVIAGQAVEAHLVDNPTARDLANQLPMTLSFRDLSRLEKIAPLPRSLTTNGVPEGDDPEIADIGYYAPSKDLVLYYGDVGYWNGIVRIGRFDNAQLSLVENQPDGFDVTIEIA